MKLQEGMPGHTNSAPRGRRRSRAVALCVVFYMLWMALLVGGLAWGRRVAYEAYGDSQAQARWSEFRQEMTRISEEGPVRRRPPQSAEPPALVLMRDYFGVCLAATLIFGSLLYGMLVVAAHGALSQDLPPRDDV